MLSKLADKILILVPNLRRNVEQVIKNSLITFDFNNYRKDILYNGC